MKKWRMANRESRIGRRHVSRNAYSQFTTHHSQFVAVFIFSCSLFAVAASAATPTSAPTVTPTPRPRLSGGFGRPAATPAAPERSNQSQSLSEVVRAADEAKTHKEQKSSVAITNDSLVTDTRKGRVSTSSPKNAPAPTAPKPQESGSVTPAVTPGASSGPAEAEWRERARTARSRVEELKQRVAELEGESKKLESDFYSWDDGSYRDGIIKPAWDRKKEELETAKKNLAQAETELADLPEKARKAGALPGWLRE
jgi:hypothetical protein